MSLPTTAEGWGVKLSLLLNQISGLHGTPRFPVDVSEIALEFSRQLYPDEPIDIVQPLSLSKAFDGALIHKGTPNEWGIFYNQDISSKGRINFTLGHELGHYLLHRKIRNEFQCSSNDMIAWDSVHGQIEAQANEFASNILIPLDDLRKQTEGQEISFDLLRHLADRYNVSLVAAALKWISVTDKRVMLVLAKDGYIDWSRSSRRLFESGIFYAAKQKVTELPQASLAANPNKVITNTGKGMAHPPGVWLGNQPVLEMIDTSKHRVMSLLTYPKDPEPNQWSKEEDEETLDMVEQMKRLSYEHL